MNHFTTPRFWKRYRSLKPETQALADKNFKLLQANPDHPSLRLKQIGIFWSVRVGIHYRALAKDREEGLMWFWIGPHDEYERILLGR